VHHCNYRLRRIRSVSIGGACYVNRIYVVGLSGVQIKLAGIRRFRCADEDCTLGI
jgi:hypothetical protein